MLSYRKLAMRVLGRPLHTGGNDSPRPASQRAAAFILTAAMLTTLAAPAFADTWCIENGNITVKAGDTEGTNKVSQGSIIDREDTNTIITNSDKDTASSNTVTIDAGNDKVEVTLDNVNIKAGSGSALTSKGDVTLTLKGDNHLTGGISDTGNYGRNGIASTGSLTITGGENGSLTAQGGSGADGGHGGHGIYSNGSLTISGGSTVTANGGNGGNVSGDGISSNGSVTISGGTVKAAGGDSKDGYGGDGIRSDGGVTISGNTVNAAGGSGGKVGGYGICSFDRVAISGGTVTANGGDGSSGGDGIRSGDIDLSGSLELTAKAGSPNGKALSQRGNELDLDDIKDKLGPGAKVTATDANGETKQVSIPRPVEPEEPSSSSDGGSATPSTPASPLPGLTVTDKSGAVISYTSTQSGNTLTVCVGRFTASLRASLSALRQLRAEGIETITFQTILCSTTLSVDELLAMGGEDAEAVLTHRLTDSSLTVG
ncbi:carbohydrate-binding domain-containing protein [Faecalibacterium longum]|uniref:Carbohydrate-binding domain-containing protein n=1 Tax=Faecalibacterium longum TaxID=1851428 RepID=A0ABV1IKG5_9FIRM|nr:carbohydrate-binding domain-containing protein [Faecalibacterium longum]MCC2183366.1 carbohydrate-binding domain-containing protein [Faecalibacterium longum CLA-AA-H236]